MFTRARATVVAGLIGTILLWGDPVPVLPDVDQVAQAQPAQSPSAQPGQPGAERTERKDQRTKYAKIFVNPDGSFTAEIYPDPIHFLDRQGTWREIDSQLEPCSAPGCAYRNRQGPSAIQFARDAARPEVLAIQDRGLKLAFGMDGARASEPRVEGTQITYPGVYEGVDWVFQVDGLNVKELLVLHEPPEGETTFRFPLTLRNLTAVENDDGSVSIVNADGETEYSLPRMFMTDSSADDNSQEPALSEDVALGVESQGDRQVLTVTPSSEWLRDPARVYPVTIDPPINDAPSRDTFVQSNILYSSQGGSNELKAGTYDSGTTKARSLIKFDISVLKGTNVSSATLSLYNNHSWSCDARWVDVHRVLGDWVEGVTWPDRPSFGADPVASKYVAKGYNSGCSAERIEFNVLDTVRNWANESWANNGFGIKARDETNNYGWKKFASSDATAKPHLIVTYNTPPGKPTDLNPNAGVTITNRSPRLSGIYHDADNGDGGFIEFKLFGPNGGRISPPADYSPNTGDFAEPGQRSGWTVPKQLDPGTYTWVARSNDHNLVSDWTLERSFTVDTSGPEAPVIRSRTHTSSTWSANRHVEFDWDPPAGADPSKGYAVVFNQNQWTTPPDGRTTGTAAWTEDNVQDGEWWIHVRAADADANWGDTGHKKVMIDWSPPELPTVTSPTHPGGGEYTYGRDDVELHWSGPDETSGIAGYSYVFDRQPLTIPPETDKGLVRTITYNDIAQGQHYFHVRAVNKAGVWGKTRHFSVRFHPLGQVSAEARSDNVGRGEEVPALPDYDFPPAVPAPPGGLADILPPGGLLGNDPLFGGPLLPEEDIATAVAGAFESFRPPSLPRPNVGAVVEGVLGDDHDLPDPLDFQPLNAVRYTVTNIRHKPGGNVRTEYEFPACQDAFYDTDSQQPFSLAAPLPGHDMHVFLCPDAASATGPAQKLDYQLDALEDAVKVEVTTRYDTIAVTGKQVRIITDAVATPHPRNLDVELSSEVAEDQTRNVLLSTSNAILQALTVAVDSGDANGNPVREGRVRIENLPANQAHRYTIEGREGNEAGTEARLHVRLEDDEPNGSETFQLESYDPADGGRLEARAILTGYPSNFDTTTTVRTAADGSGGQAPPEQLVISGSQPEAPSQLLRLEQWNGDRRLGEVRVSSFAPAYEYRAEVVRDDQNRQNGVVVTARFAQGPPEGGSFRIERYRRNDTQGNDELDARVLVERFAASNRYRAEATRNAEGRIKGAIFTADFGPQAPASGGFELGRFRRNDATNDDVPLTLFDASGLATQTTLRAEVEGDPADPTGLQARLTNSDAVADQLIEILQNPVEGEPSRMVLVGPAVDGSAVAAPVQGQNLRWDAVPQAFTLDLDLTRQQNGSPEEATVEVTDASAVTAQSVMRLTDVSANETLGLILKSPNAHHLLRVALRGPATRPDRALIAANSFGPRPQSAMQLFLRSDGDLVSQVRFMGPEATMDGLVAGSGSRLDGVARNVPESFEYGVVTTTNAAGIPTDARIQGTNNRSVESMTVDLVDKSRDLSLHQRSLPTSYRYEFHAKRDNTGSLRGAAVSGEHPEANPNGALSLRYRNFEFLVDSMTTTFRYDVDVQGDFSNPTGATLKQEQSSENDAQNVQFVRYQSGARSAVLSFRNRSTPVIPETGTHLDAVWTGVPEDFTLDVGREENQDRGRVAVRASLSSGKPGGSVRLRSHRGQQTQTLYLNGLARELSTRFRYIGQISDPKTVHVDVAASARNEGDVIQVANLDGGVVTQRLTLKGAEGAAAPITTGGTKADVSYTALPPALVLDLQRTKRDGHDVSYDVNIRNQTVGATLGDRSPVRNDAGVLVVNMKSGDESGEYVQLRDLPATAHLAYHRPPVFVQADDDPEQEENCLGQLTYEASDSGMDIKQSLDLAANYDSRAEACIKTGMRATITDMPSQGLARAELLRDGEAVFQTRNDQAIGAIDVTTGPPAGEEAFLNKDVSPPPTQLCPAVGWGTEHFGCQTVTIRANPEFRDIEVRVVGSRVRRIDLRTNYDENGNSKPFPGGDAIDEFIWEYMPLIGIRYQGDARMQLSVDGADGPEAGNSFSQEVECCFRFSPQKANYKEAFSFDGLPLKVRFYGWTVDAQDRKFNRNGEQLSKGFGSYIHTHNPFSDPEPIPFPPLFIIEDPTSNGFLVNPGETAYFVPNLYDSFMSQVGDPLDPADRQRWFAMNYFGLWQTDWFFHSLLHEIQPDPLGFNDG